MEPFHAGLHEGAFAFDPFEAGNFEPGIQRGDSVDEDGSLRDPGAGSARSESEAFREKGIDSHRRITESEALPPGVRSLVR
jgi:hypothetical protein